MFCDNLESEVSGYFLCYYIFCVREGNEGVQKVFIKTCAGPGTEDWRTIIPAPDTLAVDSHDVKCA